MKIIILFFSFIYLFANNNIIIQLKWKYQFQFAGFIMAKEKGFYQKRGLNIKFKELDDTTDVVDFVLNTPNSYGVGDSSLIYNIMNKQPIKLLMPIYDESPFVLVSLNKKIKNLQNLNSKDIILNRFTMKNPAILSMLKSQDINIEHLKINKDNFYKNFNKQKAFVVYKSNEIYTLRKQNIPYHSFDPKDYGFDFYGDILFTSNQQTLKNSLITKKIIEATKEGYIYAFNHIDETVNMILSKYNTQNLTREKLLYEARILKKYLSKTFKFDINKLNNIQKIYILLGLQKKPVNIKSYIFEPSKLTKEEKEFLRTHVIKVITTYSWEPFNLKQNGKLAGIAIDYWKYIKHLLHIKSTCVIDNNWENVLKAIKNKKADLTCSTTITPDREKYALFSKPYVSFPIVIATRNDIGFISDLNLLSGQALAVGKNYTAEKLLKKYYKNIKLVEVSSTDEALKLVNEGRVFGAVDILPVIAYKINKYEYANLKISGRTPWMFDVRFMIRKDYPELVSIINKMIDYIPQSEKEKIYQKWVSVKYQKGYTKNYIYNIIFISVVIVGIFFVLILFLLKNIKKRTILEVELKTLATMDRLTSIFNRYKIDMALNEQIEIAKRYDRPLSVIFLDIDHFKRVNDVYGHKTGDLVLIEIAKIVSENIRSSDIFGRWGGEEFLLILPETSLKEAVIIAEKLRRLIEKNNFSVVEHITCSFGVTSYSKGDNTETLIERVDKLLYQSKENGRNRVSMN